jgi:polar amino acid transport system substrate-binding protein
MRGGRRALRMTALLCAGVVAVGAGGACSKKDKVSVGPQGNTVEQGRALTTVNAGKLTVCSDVPRPPFEFEEGGELRGIDIDLARAVTGRLGIAADFKDVDGPGLFDALKAGQCDVIASAVPITNDKQKEFSFTQGYFDVRQSVLVRKSDADAYKDPSALSGHNVGVISGSPGADIAAKQLSGATIKPFADADALLAALKAGQIDAAVQDDPVNAYHALTTGQTAVVKTFSDYQGQEYGFVVLKDKRPVLDAVNSAMSQVRSDDSYRTILTNYLGSSAGQS